MEIKLVDNVVCPVCGITEVNPKDPTKICIRAFKVHSAGKWWSQCLVCSGGYDNAQDLNWDESEHDPNKGWFKH